jgi:DNA-binding SARP family transcriptional activator/tetratricopeptide (TPR) repeat protein
LGWPKLSRLVCRHGKERPLPENFLADGHRAGTVGGSRGMIWAMRRLDVRLLGRFEVAVDARRVAASAWEHRRAEDLVKLLALSPGHRLTRDEVVEALWPHLGAKAGVANLHKAVYYARRALGWPEAIVVRHGVVALAPEDRVETDVARLETEGGWDGEVGELLPEDRYEEWIVEHSDRLAELRTAALRREGRWAELLRADPTDEEITRALMRERAASGDRAAAVQQFRRLREALAKLGLTPSEESLSLYREVSRGDPVHAPARSWPPMVGRDRELAAARRALDAAARGGGGALLILGDAGIGKTRLLDAVLEDAQVRGWHTFRGAGREEEGRPPYAPIIEAIDPLVAARPDLLESLNESSRRVLALLCPSAAPGGGGPPVDVERHHVFAAVWQLVHAAAGEAGVLMALEDLHAADVATLLLAHYLSRAARREPVLVVLTARHGEAGPELARVRASLREQRAGVEIVLRPLTTPALTDIAERAAGRPLGEGTLEAIAAAAAGNPFFAEEIAASVDDGDVRVPEHVSDILDVRLGHLPADARPVVLLAAALQDGFAVSDLAMVAGVDPASAEAAVSAALRRGVLERDASGLRFRHPLLRDAARQQLDPERLIDAHLRAAARLDESGGAPEQAGYHLLAAGRGREAVPLLREAARRAAGVGAYRDGQRWAEQALAHAPTADRGELLELLGDLRHAAGDRRAARTFAAAADTASPDRLTDLRIKQARALTAAGDPSAGLAMLRDLTATTGAEQARLAIAAGMVAWYAGDLNQARRQAELANSLIDEADSERGELADLQALLAHAAGTWEGHAEWQLAEVWHVPELAGRVFDVYTCVTEYVLHVGDPYARLAEFARRLREHARAGGALRGEAFATTLLGEIELLTGDPQAARTHLLEAAALSREAGAIGGEALARARLGEALTHLVERSEAREQLDEALALAHASALADHLLYIVHGPLLRLPEDPAEALALVDRAEALLDETPKCLFCPIDYYLAATAACARAGDATRAHAFLARVEQTAGLWNGRPWAPAAAEARGAVLRADGDKEAATQALRRAITGYATAGQRLNEARARRSLNDYLATPRHAGMRRTITPIA